MVQPAISEPLELAIEAAAAAWPSFTVPKEDIVAALEQSGVAGDQLTAELHLADLYLARGCLLGDRAALAVFDRDYLRQSTNIVARLDSSADFIGEVSQALREKLLVGTAESPPRLSQYRGDGPMRGWLAVAAHRLALDMLRKRGRSPVQSRPDTLAQRLCTAPTAELELLKARHKRDFEEALRAALATLTPRESVILNLSVVEGLSLQRIAKVYNVDQSTVWRWLSRARAQILMSIRSILHERLGMEPSDIRSLVGLIGSQVDVSLAGLLASED